MKRGKSTGKPTKAEIERFHRLRLIGCIACELSGEAFTLPDTEIHHIVDKGYRKHSGGHMATIPLCSFHHRGEPPYVWTKKLATERLGPSLALNKKAFVARFGAERELLELVNKRLGEA